MSYNDIDVDLSFTPIPQNYFEKDENFFESDELIKELTYEEGIYPLAGL